MLVPTQPVHSSQLEGLELLHNSQLEGLELYRTLHNSQLEELELHRLYATPSWKDSNCTGLSAFTNTKDNDPLQLNQMTEKRRATTSLLKKRALLLPLPRELALELTHVSPPEHWLYEHIAEPQLLSLFALLLLLGRNNWLL